MPPSNPLVLLYHRMGSPLVRSTVRGQYVLPSFLRWQVDDLLRQGYRAAPLAALVAAPDPGQFAITFDDGYTSVGRYAWPLLLARHIPMTLFVVVAAIGGTNLWDQRKGDRVESLHSIEDLRTLAASGMEIGSHTLTHARLTDLSDADLRTEVADAKKQLEDLLGREVPGFSYPYGAWDARVRDAVIAAGYQYATATTLGTVGTGTDPFAIPRVNMRWNTVGPIFARKVRRAQRKGG